MKKILVTGANGFLGRHVIPLLLKHNYHVYAVDNNITMGSEKKENLSWHECNLFDPEDKKSLFSKIKPTHLLHLAWYTVPKKYWTAPENVLWVKASIELFFNFLENGGRRAVFAGTCAEYNWDYELLSEDKTPLLPKTLYGKCKNSLNTMLGALAEQKDISYAWGRIFFLYGSGENKERLIPEVINSLLKGKEVNCSHGRQVRDFLHVEDVADAFVTLVESNLRGSVNIASGQPATLKQIIYKIAEKLDRKDLIRLNAVPSSKSEPLRLIADNKRLKNELKWKPKYNLDSGLEKTIKWWKKEISGYKKEKM
ncbi:MAG: epimerase [Elusimicrobia bacterium RIFOXYD2_FULL_34_15]|nr:MAG: epimerase [Elusimicrobia bacterium RIFOXYD2_FULL_34_15]